MKMPEGWNNAFNLTENPCLLGVKSDQLRRFLLLVREMADTLEALTTDLDLLCEDASGNIERASEVIKKFQEWE